MKLARPPHYIDRIGRLGRETAYSAYGQMGYHYVGANIDGGGYLPTCGDYDKDVQAMVKPLQAMLEQDPDSLNGAVIFQKDGYNLSLQSPIADALAPQLELLVAYGYKIVSVSELMQLSPFEDVHANDICLDAVRGLDGAGYAIGFKNNTFKPSAPITQEQLEAMCTKRQLFTPRRIKQKNTLHPDEIQRIIAKHIGDCGPVGGATRGDAAIALWQACNLFPLDS